MRGREQPAPTGLFGLPLSLPAFVPGGTRGLGGEGSPGTKLSAIPRPSRGEELPAPSEEQPSFSKLGTDYDMRGREQPAPTVRFDLPLSLPRRSCRGRDEGAGGLGFAWDKALGDSNDPRGDDATRALRGIVPSPSN